MGIGTEMQQLARDIAQDRDQRAAAIDQINDDARAVTGQAKSLLKEFSASRRKTSRANRSELETDKSKRSTEVKALQGDARGLVKGFHASRKEHASRLKKTLSASTLQRRHEVAEMAKDSSEMVESFTQQRRGHSARQRQELSQSRSQRQGSVNQLKQNSQAFVSGLGVARRESAGELRAKLDREQKALHSAVAEAQTMCRKNRADLKNELKQAGQAWDSLSNTRLAPRPKVALPITTEAIDWQTRVKDLIIGSPNGATLTEIAGSLGVVPVVLGKVAKNLIDQGIVRKENKLYFPIGSNHAE